MKSNYLNILKETVLHYLRDEDVSIALFGSYAKNCNYHGSDVDIAIIPHADIARWKISELREIISEHSYIPFKVDLVDFSMVSEEFKTQSLLTAVWWRN